MHIYGNIKKVYRQALEFYASRLFSPQLSRYIGVSVRFRNFTGGFHGHVLIEDYNGAGVPRSFTIELNRGDSEKETLITLAHELIHCYQYAMKQLNEEMSVWHGKKVNADKIPYDEQPWEIEAETVGIILYESFIATHESQRSV
jgi:hypothetical protein